MIGLRDNAARRAPAVALGLLMALWMAAAPASAQDFWVDAPGTWTGNTCGQGDDCWMEIGDEHEYAVNIPWPGYWHFDLCDSMFDTLLAIGPVRCSCDYG